MSLTKGSKAAQDVISFLHTMGRLKETARQGWLDTGIPSPESISDHMYRMSLMCMMCPDTSLNRDRMIKMALCHDVAESIIGDISPAMKIPTDVKRQRELQAIRQLCTLVSSSPNTTFSEEIGDLFGEYEAQETTESHFVKDMDLLEMVVQAHGYEAMHPGKDLSSFFRSGAGIRHPWARAIFETLLDTRPYLAHEKEKQAGEKSCE